MINRGVLSAPATFLYFIVLATSKALLRLIFGRHIAGMCGDSASLAALCPQVTALINRICRKWGGVTFFCDFILAFLTPAGHIIVVNGFTENGKEGAAGGDT